jgi:hypothetical protein
VLDERGKSAKPLHERWRSVAPLCFWSTEALITHAIEPSPLLGLVFEPPHLVAISPMRKLSAIWLCACAKSMETG